jgi:sugar (pentulose or hexulose) kinase
MEKERIKEAVAQGKTYLGIELGSTRIKAMLIGEDHSVIASGSHGWENSFSCGVWTYGLDEVWQGLRACYADLARDVKQKCGEPLRRVGAMCISAMMHGYLPFDKDGGQLAPFRTWRNTTTGRAAEELTELLSFNIPQRWSAAHLYQAVLDGEEHVSDVALITTLAGYVHKMLTGRSVLGVGDASGMFPIDSLTRDFDEGMLAKFDGLTGPVIKREVRSILPGVLSAGQAAGELTKEGALLLDPTGTLEPGCPLCPPEGDAGTGMAATNSVGIRTGNVSAGTSIFAMVVLERPLGAVHTELDMVTTPDGSPVAMVHCNNCTSDIDAWVRLFCEFAEAAGMKMSFGQALDVLFSAAQSGEPDCGGLMNYNYLSGEPITGLERGRPLFVRTPDSRFTLSNFMRAHLQSALATLRLGFDVLSGENVRIDRMYGHGGYFKTAGVGQRFMAAAIKAPVYVMETAGEGGAWGAALLAAYMMNRSAGQSLESYLAGKVFAGTSGKRVDPDDKDIAGFEEFMARYVRGLEAERAAAAAL